MKAGVKKLLSLLKNGMMG